MVRPVEMQANNFRQVLKREFEARCKRNPRYSLRAFARDLDFLPSRLSDVINGKQGLSRRSAEHMAQRLGFSKSETEWFAALVEKKHARSSVKRQAAEKIINEAKNYRYLELRDDLFTVVSDWYHFPILELTTLSDFVADKDWIARRLGISPIEAELAIERLISVGLLENKNGTLKALTTFPASTSEIPSKAIKECHTQILEKATKALYLQDVERRDFSAVTMAIDPNDLPEIKKHLKKFRRLLERNYKKKPQKTAVYCLSMQFFELTKI